MINSLIVDDAPIARDILLNYCSHLPEIKIIASCGNAFEAKVIIESQHIDLIFLDINLPVLSGIGFMATLKKNPEIIFTTAYKEYASDAFDLSACDYLLKPFSLERFIIAVDKAKERIAAKINQPSKSIDHKVDYVFIKTDGQIFKIYFNDLLYAEANGNYIKVVTIGKTLNPLLSFTAFEEHLPVSEFVRIHRPFIINKTKITRIQGNRIFINNHELPIGVNYKDTFFKNLGL